MLQNPVCKINTVHWPRFATDTSSAQDFIVLKHHFPPLWYWTSLPVTLNPALTSKLMAITLSFPSQREDSPVLSRLPGLPLTCRIQFTVDLASHLQWKVSLASCAAWFKQKFYVCIFDCLWFIIECWLAKYNCCSSSHSLIKARIICEQLK